MKTTISKMIVYPIKSTGGFEINESHLEARGLAWDRRYMLVDQAGVFLTARKLPKMVSIQCTPDVNGFRVSAPQMNPIFLPFASDLEHAASSTQEVNIWKDDLEAYPVDPDISKWFSQFLDQPVQLVSLGPKSNRSIENKIQVEPTSFADKYPLLLISEASLKALNEKLKTPVTMDHFRPNIVVSGCAAFEEDTWSEITINGVQFKSGGLCARCSLVNVNPDTGTSHSSGEPLKTLSGFRKKANGVMFGVNLVPKSTGSLKKNMLVES